MKNNLMKTSILLSCVAVCLTGTVNAQSNIAADMAKDRYQRRIAAADKVKNDGIAKLTQNYDNEVKLAQDDLKNAFEPLIRSYAMRNQTKEVAELANQLNSLLGVNGVSSDGTGRSNPSLGIDYKNLIGIWTTPSTTQSMPGSSYQYTFEFRSDETVIQSYAYKSTSGDHTTTREYSVSRDEKLIVLKPRHRSSTSSSSTSQETWEIALPFNRDQLEITRRYNYNSSDTTSTSTSTYKLSKVK